jgi:hypothetical protein
MNSAALKSWGDYVARLLPHDELAALLPDPQDEQLRAALYQQIAMNFTLGYFLYFGADAEQPDWLPFLNSVFLLQPNPDDAYLIAPLRGDRSYRIVGERGSVHLLTLDLSASLMGERETLDASRSVQLDLDCLERDDGGRFELLLSAERPPGHRDNWQALPDNVRVALVRQRSYRWGHERDARLAIECLDPAQPKPRLSPAQIDRGLEDVLAYAGRLSKLWLNHMARLRARQRVNEFEFHAFGGGLARQAYWQALFEFGPDEVLVLETELPEKHRYWNVQLNDPLFNTIEFVQRQSSLNGAQATIDADGRFRAVVALEDPGVPNWLDPCGHTSGTLIGRWYECSSTPMPTLRRVPRSQLRELLPEATPFWNADKRRAGLADRRIGAQLRRRW